MFGSILDNFINPLIVNLIETDLRTRDGYTEIHQRLVAKGSPFKFDSLREDYRLSEIKKFDKGIRNLTERYPKEAQIAMNNYVESRD
jgi:hypothetical protein